MPAEVAAADQLQAAVRELEDVLREMREEQQQIARRLHLKRELYNTAPWAFRTKARLRKEIESLG